MNNEITQDKQEWVSIREAAIILGVSVDTIRRRISRGTIPARRDGQIIRIRRTSLDRYGKPVTNMRNGHK